MVHDTTGIIARFQLAHGGASHFKLDVDLRLPGRGVTALYGPSGAGKTTLLRCIAGLQPVAGGLLQVNGTTWQDATSRLPTHHRPLGYVFQEASLFPHLTARGNLHYASQRAGDNKTLDEHILALMGIEALLDRYPAQLSGGERQRVAIARALLARPRLLLMDEPLASLDMARKREILPYLEKLHSECELPILYVSHSTDEVARLADYLVVLEQGAVRSQGPIGEVLPQLSAAFGDASEGETAALVEARVAERNDRWQLIRATFPGGELWIRDHGDAIGNAIRLRILARDISLALHNHTDTSILNRLPAEVSTIAADGDPAMAMVHLAIGPTRLVARITQRSVEHLQLTPGMTIWAQLKSVAVVR